MFKSDDVWKALVLDDVTYFCELKLTSVVKVNKIPVFVELLNLVVKIAADISEWFIADNVKLVGMDGSLVESWIEVVFLKVWLLPASIDVKVLFKFSDWLVVW